MTVPSPAPKSTVVTTDDGARLHVELDGSATAPVTVLFAHGWTMSERCWLPVLDELRATGADPAAVRLVRFDQRGHGRSTRGRHTPVSIDRLGEDLAVVIAAVSPDRPVILVGHSMGGMSIMALAAARPEMFGSRVVGVALVSTSAGGLRQPAKRVEQAISLGLRAPALVDLLRKAYPPSRAGFQRRLRESNFGPHATPEMVRSAAEIFHGTPSRTVLEYLPALMAHDKIEHLAALDGVPVSIVVGESDRLTSVRHAQRLADRLAHADLHVEPESGHLIITEKAPVVAKRIHALIAAA